MKLILSLALLVVSCRAQGQFNVKLPGTHKIDLPKGFKIIAPVLPSFPGTAPTDSSPSPGSTDTTDAPVATGTDAADPAKTGSTDATKPAPASGDSKFVYQLWPGFDLIFKNWGNVKFEKGETATKSKSGSKSKDKSNKDKSKKDSKAKGDDAGATDAPADNTPATEAP